MPEAKLTIRIPDQTWIGDVSRAFPDARFRILAGIPGDGTGVALVELEAPRVDDVLDAMRAADTLVELDVLQRRDGRALLQAETTLPLLLLASSESGLPPEMPFDIRDGEATWTLTAPRERLSELGEQFERLGVAYDLDYLRDGDAPSRLLTDRQAEVVAAALDAGYYDTPRGCTLTALADREGMAKSTLSEVVHRAEERIVKHYAADERERGT